MLHLCHAVVSLSYEDKCQQGLLVHRTCATDREARIATFLTVAFSLLYFGITCSILVFKLKWFQSQPYIKVQVAFVFYRLQVSSACTALITWCARLRM